MPFWIFHVPLIPTIIRAMMRAKHPLFFSAANPIMWREGAVGIGKSRVLDGFPEALLPYTQRVEHLQDVEQALAVFDQAKQQSKVDYPLIVKPEAGMRGQGVVRVRNKEELVAALAGAKEGALLIQEFIDKPLEIGLMYVRERDQERGQITSLANKRLPVVVGDGQTPLGELIEAEYQDQRHLLKRVRSLHADGWTDVPANGERVLVEFVGQPFLGARVECLMDQITEPMVESFDRLCAGASGFSLGRFDLKADNLSQLERGEGFKILELNLTGSIPLHFWDPRYGTGRFLSRHAPPLAGHPQSRSGQPPDGRCSDVGDAGTSLSRAARPQATGIDSCP